tara:strand:- start:858 stop:1832 length:975 start_codon:yes stop_codon:yes gene_type:complete
MLDYSDTFDWFSNTPLRSWLDTLPQHIKMALSVERWGDLPDWHTAYQALPKIRPSALKLNQSAVTIGGSSDCAETERQLIEQLLRQFHPWRKGPYRIHDIHIDTEWRSDWKWDRVQPYISPLTNRRILDVGCGSGYHCWRMLGEGARQVVGIDPSPKFVYQFAAIKHFAGQHPITVLPVGIEQVPEDNFDVFDTVLSMGVLYHRRSPIDHLYQLKQLISSGGELILETLVVDGPLGMSLMPKGRYAKMRNVWFIPSVLTLEHWLKRCGFKNVRTVDVSKTELTEQRRTDWMRFESLKDFLDPDDQNKTIEGYPAPVRAVVIANK